MDTDPVADAVHEFAEALVIGGARCSVLADRFTGLAVALQTKTIGPAETAAWLRGLADAVDREAAGGLN